MIQLFLLALAAVAAAPRGPARAEPPARPRPEPPAADPRDVESPERIVAALYEIISGPAGKKRDWDRLRSLFIPGGRLMPTGPRPAPGTPPDAPLTGDEEYAVQVLDVDGYAERADLYFQEHGFFEREVARRADGFGHVMHVFSTFDSRHNEDDPEPFARGINSIQLMNDGRRWWVVSIFWEAETPRTPIPQKYLTGTRERAAKGADKGAAKSTAKGARKAARKNAR